MVIDYLIAGSGLTGAVIARELSDRGFRVLVLERRAQIGGNVHDYHHSSGIRIHSYGPHYFRTDDENIWQYVNRFSRFYRYEPELKSFVDGAYENWPISGRYLNQSAGPDWLPSFTGTPANFEEASLAMMPEEVYRKFVKGYTEKQWGVNAGDLSPDLARRFDVRMDNDPRLVRHRHQGIPVEGYASFMLNLLSGIPVLLNFDYLLHRDFMKPRCKLIFTGPIDEYFGYRFGRLKYRGQIRKDTYIPDAEYIQPCGQVNNPDAGNGEHIRILEWKHMMQQEHARRISGTVLTSETPCTPVSSDHYEYPFPDRHNAELYSRYRAEADKIGDVLICGRLGEYQYYDMDRAIARALALAAELTRF
jgi:UDP-galactopyranose mutase